jgi:phosphate transport system permease protein
MILDASSNKHLLKRKKKDALFGILCFIAASIGVLLLITFLSKIVIDGLPKLSWKFIVGDLSNRARMTGIWQAVVGSIYVMVLTAIISVPVGVGAAIYLEEFTRRKTKLTQLIQLNIANLSGVPSIVYGLLGRVLFVYFFGFKQSVIAGALTMSLLILPTVIIITQEALRAVPKSYRDGSLALGSTQWQAIRLQVLPNAAPGILTGIILSISRAIGETAPLIVVGAAGFVANVPKGLRDTYTVLPIKIFDWANDSKEEFHQVAASAILVLMVALLAMNSVAIFLRARQQSRMKR